ncbi:hypothetical protein H6F32_14565 [Anabaena sp. FACHB-1237]|uniref:hypothetical protein n=1 Tax=Anabaena sp. FACHB-1237 TaxID=2692769 RepID=UPI0016805416|nr:hypothetical protein [Anabaena sp. FACHB-1237]MBD2138772.1 hypothetical protein [Anabaena sp. FACHB-1237]
MATYKQLQEYIKNKHQRIVKSCWIADAKEKLGLPVKPSYHRSQGQQRKYPCPDDILPIIREALEHFDDL